MAIVFPKPLAAFLDSPFLKGSFIYLLGSILNSLLPLALMPVLTRHLTPTDYSMVATGTVLVQILVVFIGVNAYGLLARGYFDGDDKSLRQLTSTSMMLSLAMAALFMVLCWVLGTPLQRFTEFPAAWLGAVLFIAVGTVIQNNYLTLLQARREPFRYIAIQTVSGALNLGVSVLLVVQWRMDWTGRMWGLIVAQSAVAVVCVHDTWRLLCPFGAFGNIEMPPGATQPLATTAPAGTAANTPVTANAAATSPKQALRRNIPNIPLIVQRSGIPERAEQ